jgi:dihydroorotase
MKIEFTEGKASALTFIWPDDWHTHVRDLEVMKAVVPITAKLFRRAVIMPNLVPAVSNLNMLKAYEERVLTAALLYPDFQPIMTLAITPKTTPADIKMCRRAGIRAAKLYPAHATTNSKEGVAHIRSLAPIFCEMEGVEMILLLHGETLRFPNGNRVSPFKKETVFVQTELPWILENFPKLKVVLEHITTAEAAELVLSNKYPNLAATITPHHLIYDVCDLFEGGFQSAFFCLPVLKDTSDKEALRRAATSGHPRIFIGTDSAPHSLAKKTDPCGCAAGVFVGSAALSMYVQVFDEMNALENLESFLSFNGPRFYGMAMNDNFIRLVRKPWRAEPPMRISGEGEFWQFGHRPGENMSQEFEWTMESKLAA